MPRPRLSFSQSKPSGFAGLLDASALPLTVAFPLWESNSNNDVGMGRLMLAAAAKLKVWVIEKTAKTLRQAAQSVLKNCKAIKRSDQLTV
ncbi:hypothetical protein BV898_14327 [Hypsibius exemplaris]|uniref:Uncharacterized protein n=1 Tax=Hypsibius exemplaris TaxID=2072580 RepID=A0A9X6RJD9_HYPEX|nr:hypothetical protein BV898_14327 [Hypsibius exemplaris]